MQPEEELEGYRQRYIASTLDAYCFLQQVVENPDETHLRTVVMTKTEMLTLIGGLTSLLGIFINSIAAENAISTKDALILVGQNLVTEGE